MPRRAQSGDGRIDEGELEAAVAVLRQIGMAKLLGELLEAMGRRKHASLGKAPSLRAAEGLDFGDFTSVMEEALAKCGFDARQRWQKAAKLAVKLSGSSPAGSPALEA